MNGKALHIAMQTAVELEARQWQMLIQGYQMKTGIKAMQLLVALSEYHILKQTGELEKTG